MMNDECRMKTPLFILHSSFITLHYSPPMDAFTLTPTADGRLTLARPGHDDVVDVRVRRAFPLSDPGRHVSVRGPDGKELLLIDNLADAPADARRTIEQTLAGGTFIPRITRVESVDVRFGRQEWTVQTDRGPAAFRVQEKEDIRFLPDGRFRVKDADGTVYDLPSLAEMDAGSRRAVEPLV